jgi:hypothetical protein
MADFPKRTMRDLRIAARDGDRAAMRALLRASGKTNMAEAVRGGQPIPPRVKRMLRALTAGIGTHDEPGPWETVDEDGTIRSLIHGD